MLLNIVKFAIWLQQQLSYNLRIQLKPQEESDQNTFGANLSAKTESC